jgi:multidrug transporter EmrE-like cation transporter
LINCKLLSYISQLYFVLQTRFIFSNTDRKQSDLGGLQPGVLRRWSTTPLTVAAFSIVVAWTFSILLIGFMVLFLGMKHGSESTKDLFKIPTYVIIPIVYSALGPTSTGFAMLTYSNKQLNSSSTLGIMPVQLLTSTVVSSAAFGAKLNVTQLLCMAIVVFGIVLLFLARRQRYEDTEQAEAEAKDENSSSLSEPMVQKQHEGTSDSSSSV